MGGSASRAQAFLAWSFSIVFIPIEGKEVTLVSERSLERTNKEMNSSNTKLRLFQPSFLFLNIFTKTKVPSQITHK